MSDDFQEDLAFEAADDAADVGEGLLLDIDGYEGPLHLLLELARKQKVDLARISILALAEQYLAFIKAAENLRIELAADYLVMASWLAYRLEAMRRAADGLFRLPITGVAVQVRGMPEGLRSRTTPLYEAELFDILKAYGESRSKATIRNHKLPTPNVLSLDEARVRLRRALAAVGITESETWTSFDALLPQAAELKEGLPSASVKASSLLAGLELTKEGQMEIRQTGTFAPIYVRAADRKVENNDG